MNHPPFGCTDLRARRHQAGMGGVALGSEVTREKHVAYVHRQEMKNMHIPTVRKGQRANMHFFIWRVTVYESRVYILAGFTVAGIVQRAWTGLQS